ncbi:ROK family transcriptional regulator [Mesorhizobium tamadayense]|uniref:ROK family transcriptional regulator n=1 Tax=Mesorhizobium tamadayense TaxID=425306 RepID=A0A3P3FQ70_9HYPH|nr:ROK family transcriptional regulator [Mesorhizobium tamadayense]RRI00732.1 ROK family transcriptional regulator [Mesorhizobium tamadayense]
MNQATFASSSPRRIRQSNAVATLNALHHFGPLSRAELARHMGVNRSSAGNIVLELVEAGLVREVPESDFTNSAGQPRAGRPGILVEIVPEAVFFIGVEIGVEHMTCVEINLAGKIIRSATNRFEGHNSDPEEAVRVAIDQAFSEVGKERLTRCQGLGITVPGQMDQNGFIHVAPILGWRNLDLTALTRSVLPAEIPIGAENDGNAFGIGITYSQPEAANGVTFFMVIETGVGGGIVIDGKLFRGGNGLAGEVGHLKTRNPTYRNLEQAFGRDRILSSYRQFNPQADLDAFLGDVRDRVPQAVQLAEEWATLFAFAVVQISRLIDPNRIVVGGSVAELYPLVAARVDAHIRNLQAETFPIPEIVFHESAAYGSAFGAACIMHQRFMSLDNQMFNRDAVSGADTFEA